MLLKYLDLQGFKSFPDKTRVAFGEGLTAVVGPNGSGKSNISDAVRWVMGEQSTKTLRGEKMEDVIFSGTKSRKSLGFAEVSLTVDNTDRELDIDSDEVTLTRRYDRSGESEYMINRSPVRLKDLHELLMDTGLGKDGYSLIGQGKIAEIIQSKSTERREIFEEAAGISKFRYRKNESERSLTRAEENLVRLRDIMSELEDRVGPLQEQSQKARRYLELAERKRSLEVSLWIDTLEKSNQTLKDQSDRLIACEEQHGRIEEDIQQIEDRIQQTFESMQKCLVDIEAMRHEKEEAETAASDAASKIAVCENDIRHNEQNIARISSELESHAQRSDTTAQEIEAKNRQIGEITEQLSALEAEVSHLQEELLARISQSEGRSQRERELADRVNTLLLEQTQIRMTIASSEMNRAELLTTVENNEAEAGERNARLEGHQTELLQTRSFLEELDERAESLQNTYNGHKMKLDNRAEKLRLLQQECSRCDLQMKERQQKAALLEGMEQSLEGFAYSVREVVKRAKNGVLQGVLGTVSQIIDVGEEYSVAVETALGGSMQNVVVQDEAAAKAAIRLLKQDNLGRATFLPLTSVSGSQLQVSGLERYGGFVDLAVNLVSFEEKYRPVVTSLLGRIAVVDDIDTAVLIAQKYGYKFRIVTLDGQVVNAGGSLTGGSRNKNQGFLSRKNEIAALRAEVAKLQEKNKQNYRLTDELQAEVNRIQAELTAVTSEITTVNEDKIRTQGEWKRLDQLVEQENLLREQMTREIAEKRNRIDSLAKLLEEKQKELSASEETVRDLSSELENLQSSNQTFAQERTELSDEISERKIRSVTLNKDIEAIRQSIADLEYRQQAADEGREKLLAEQTALEIASETIRGQIAALRGEIEQGRVRADGLDVRIREVMEERQRLEGLTTQYRKEERERQEQKEKIASELVRMDERKLQLQREYDGLIEKLWNEYELTRSEAQKIAEPVEDAQRAGSELNSVRSKIRALGSVNVDAIEEYREVSERYEFLKSQIGDAEQSRAELIRLIGELTQKMQNIFLENFEKINTQFKRIFVELFGGGRAELRLTDPGHLLESGIEIMVEPPGKIINNLAALSGGEQAFVAIAIYFAILKVHPAPFCILDEIEAALDDVNVDKYAEYLRAMCDRTQFIAITHRRGTMEAADILYGVTMQDEGVSKLLQLKVSEIESKLGVQSK